jgi:hypothetical protein
MLAEAAIFFMCVAYGSDAIGVMATAWAPSRERAYELVTLLRPEMIARVVCDPEKPKLEDCRVGIACS